MPAPVTTDAGRPTRGGSLALLLALLSLGWVAGCGEDSGLVDEIGMGKSVTGSVVLRFAAIPNETRTRQRRQFRSLVVLLEERLGVPVAFVPSSDPNAMVDMFRNGDIHFAWFGGLAGVQAREAVPRARAIAQGVEDASFYSYFTANRKLELAPSSAFPIASRGLRFSFGSERSTSGRLMPEHFIRAATGGTPGEFYSQVAFSGSHRKTLALVNAGSFDLGAINSRVYDAAAPDEKVDTLVLWKTPSYANYSFSVRPDLDDIFRAGFSDELQQALLAMPRNATEGALSRSSLITASNDQFAAIEDAARRLGLVH